MQAADHGRAVSLYPGLDEIERVYEDALASGLVTETEIRDAFERFMARRRASKEPTMTTKITITHDGPDHRNVKVAEFFEMAPEHNSVRVLKTGQSHTAHVYPGRRVEVSETDEPATE